MSECQALTAFATAIATVLPSADQFVEAFGVLTPQIPGMSLQFIAWNSNPVSLGYQGNSGFATQYQDGYGTSAGPNANDQSHHFAAFFQLGYNDQYTAGVAPLFWETQGGLQPN